MKAVEHQVMLVTDATDGLGKRVARDLAARGTTVLLHGRSSEKGEATLQELQAATGKRRAWTNAQAYDQQARRRLRILSEHLTRILS